MKKITKVSIFILMILCMSLPVQAKGKVKLNHKKIVLTVGDSKTLKLKNAKGKVKWKSKKQKIAKISKKGIVKAKKAGTTTIIATSKGKSYKCTIVVTSKKKNTKKTSNNTKNNKDTKTNQVSTCKHDWKEIMKTVHHDAVYEKQTIEEGIAYYYYCRDCEKWYPDATYDHCSNGCDGYLLVKPAKTAVVCVQEAYDEEVGTGVYRCTKCNQTK